MSFEYSPLRVPAAGLQWFLAGDLIGCTLPCEREAVLLMCSSLSLGSYLGFCLSTAFFSDWNWLGDHAPPPPRPRPVSSPPQLELVLLLSPSCYLIAEEPELAPPWVWLLCRQDRCCFPRPSSFAGGKSVGTPEELSTQGLGHSSVTSEDGKADSGAWLLKQFGKVI